MEKETIQFEMERDELTNSVVIFLRDEKINRALKELKRADKNSLAIIQDTIKILEEGIEVNDKQFEAKAFADLAAPLQAKPIPNAMKEVKVEIPNLSFDVTAEDLAKAMNSDNMFMGGMR